MKVMITTLCLMSFFICSCRDTPESSSIEDPNVLARHDEIRKIMREYCIQAIDVSRRDVNELEEIRRMKEDYYYESSDPETAYTIPGPKWEIRGPFTIEQVEQESLEEMKESPDVPQVPFGYINDFWNKLIKNKYQEGDELYYYSSDPTSWSYLQGQAGYVLIRNNKVVDAIPTRIN